MRTPMCHTGKWVGAPGTFLVNAALMIILSGKLLKNFVWLKDLANRITVQEESVKVMEIAA
jgi:hypothetical protein